MQIDPSLQAMDRDHVEVIGRDGVLAVEPAFVLRGDRASIFRLTRGDGKRASIAIVAANEDRALLDHVADVIDGRRPLEWTLADSRAVVAVLEALAASTVGSCGAWPLGSLRVVPG